MHLLCHSSILSDQISPWERGIGGVFQGNFQNYSKHSCFVKSCSNPSPFGIRLGFIAEPRKHLAVLDYFVGCFKVPAAPI